MAAMFGGAYLLLKEAKTIPNPIPVVHDAVSGSGAAAGQTTAGQTINQILWGWRNEINVALDQAGRTRTAAQIEAGRVGSAGYGTVSGSVGEQTGVWSDLGNGRCSLLVATTPASNATRYFTGGYCRRAKAQGLI
jgi:hypothetical protein